MPFFSSRSACSVVFSLLLSAAYFPSAAAQVQALPDTARPAKTTLLARPLMVKVGVDIAHLWNGAFGVGVPLYAGAERQVTPRWSITADAYANLTTGTYYQPGPHLYTFGAAIGTRYYYNQAARARKGKPLRPLTGNYLQLQYTSAFEGYPKYTLHGDEQFVYRHLPNIDLLWGMQRRFGKHGFYDAGVGLRIQNRFQTDNYGINHLGGGWIVLPTARLRVGLAF